MVSYDDCDTCGIPHARWREALRMTLCARCERTGGDRAAREPVLLGEVLAATAALLSPTAQDAALSAGLPGLAGLSGTRVPPPVPEDGAAPVPPSRAA
ncbi:hypothetical protein [Streptomyces sp. NPDC054887]